MLTCDHKFSDVKCAVARGQKSHFILSIVVLSHNPITLSPLETVKQEEHAKKIHSQHTHTTDISDSLVKITQASEEPIKMQL